MRRKESHTVTFIIAVRCRNEAMKMTTITKKILSITLLLLLTAGVVAAADDDINPDA